MVLGVLGSFGWFRVVSRSLAWFCEVSRVVSRVVSCSLAWFCKVSHGFAMFLEFYMFRLFISSYI